MARPMSRRRRRSRSMVNRAHMLPSSERAGATHVGGCEQTRRVKEDGEAKRPVGRGGLVALGRVGAGPRRRRSSRCSRYGRGGADATAGAAGRAPDGARAGADRRSPVEVASCEAARAARRSTCRRLARPLDAPPGERDNPIAATRAPAEWPTGGTRLAPAPDQRASPAGRRPTHALRLDRSTLHARLQRRRGGGAARRACGCSAPPRLAAGDPPRADGGGRRLGAQRGADPRADLAGASPALLRPGRSIRPARRRVDAPAARRPRRPRSPPRVDPAARCAAHGVGPLDAEAGRAQLRRRAAGSRGGRSHPAHRLGRAASRDHRFFACRRRRGAVAFADGRGPSQTPGAVAAPVSAPRPPSWGRAPATSRAPTSTSGRPIAATSGTSRRFARGSTPSTFPKALALRLEQGETIVGFVVGADGRLVDGPRVLKSSGFEEFDAAARARGAARRAVPAAARPRRGTLAVGCRCA